MSSPLDEARPTSLDELFSRDPDDTDDQDIDAIVEELWRASEKWVVQEATEPATRGRPKKQKYTLEDLDLSDLLGKEMQ